MDDSVVNEFHIQGSEVTPHWDTLAPFVRTSLCMHFLSPAHYTHPYPALPFAHTLAYPQLRALWASHLPLGPSSSWSCRFCPGDSVFCAGA
jgi:hypothetical protein